MTKKIFAMFLALLMVASVLPTSVFAANEHPAAGKHNANNCDCTVIAVTEPTCGQTGYTTYKCKTCGEVFADNFVAATGEHSMVAGERKEPTCGVAGYEAGMKCENCSYVEPGETIDPVFKAGYTCEYEDLNPDINCTTGGVKNYKCVVCGHTYSDTIKKGNHSWNFKKYTVKVEPTETEAGIIVIPCSKCSATKEASWFDAHSCAEAADLRDAIPVSCFNDGVAPHYECRVCGKLYAIDGNEMGEEIKPGTAEYDALFTKGGHVATNPLSGVCRNFVDDCSRCGAKDVTFTVEHELVPTDNSVNYSAKCTEDGFQMYECTNGTCPYTTLKTIPAKGHIEKTITVPATCGTYEYTYTICLRKDCPSNLNASVTETWEDKKGVVYNVAVDHIVADVLSMGDVSYLLSYTTNVYNDVFAITLEQAFNYKGEPMEGKFYVKTSPTTYLTIRESLVGHEGYGYIKAALGQTTVAETVFQFNETYGVLTATLENGEYFLAQDMYRSGTYLVVREIHQFESARYQPLVMYFNTNDGVCLTGIKVNTDGGFNADEHNTDSEWATYPTCTTDGYIHYFCTNLGCTYSETVKYGMINHSLVGLYPEQYEEYPDNATQDQKDEVDDYNESVDDYNESVLDALIEAGYVADTVTYSDPDALQEVMLQVILDAGFSATLKNMYRETTCTQAGWQYVLCLSCGDMSKDTTAAYGHTFMTWLKPFYQAPSHTTTGGEYIPCAYCSETLKITVEAWADSNKIYDSLTDANASNAHNGGITGAGVLYRAGDCTTAGLLKYTCDGCNKAVYVKQEKEVTIKLNGVDYTFDHVTGGHIVLPYILGADIVKYKADGETIDVAIDTDIIKKGDIVYDATNEYLKTYAEALLAEARVTNPDAKLVHYTAAADCEEVGYVVTYKCALCDKVVGNTAIDMDSTNDKEDGYTGRVLSKTSHKFEIYRGPDEATFNPCPNGVPYRCVYCGSFDNVLDSSLGNSINKNTCENIVMQYYKCSCGEEHVRGIYGEFGHVYQITSITGDKHDGQVVTYSCIYCDPAEGVKASQYTETLPAVHENADEEEFTNQCTDEVEDRHCVLCCDCASLGNSHDCYKTDDNGKYICDCMIPADHRWDDSVQEEKGSTCTMSAYKVQICKDCGKQVVKPETKFAFNFTDLVAVSGQTYYELSAALKDALIIWANDTATDKIIAGSGAAGTGANEGKTIVGVKDYMDNVKFMGHKPARVDYLTKDGKIVYENGKPVEIRYANYHYEEIIWTSYEYMDVMVPVVKTEIDHETAKVTYSFEYKLETVLVQRTEKYVAKYSKYEEATYAADGVMATECQICKAEVEQVLPKKTGIGFEMSIANANGQSGFGFGSLIEVTVNMNGLNAGVYGFDFDITNNVGAGMLYVGYEVVSEDFNVTVTSPEMVAQKGKALKVSGFAVNNDAGKVQNIVISEETPVVKLYFRSMGATGKYAFTFANTSATALKDGATKPTKTPDNFEDVEFSLKGLMDFNGDGKGAQADLYQAMTLITGEHASGKTYDVTVDLNKDGELTLEDLAIGYNYLVGNYEEIEMLLLGLSAEEVEQLVELLKEKPAHTCLNESCEYGSKYYFDVCPICRTVQPEQKTEEPEVVTVKCSEGHENAAGAKYCAECGDPLVHECKETNCDYSQAEEFNYCPECGKPQA